MDKIVSLVFYSARKASLAFLGAAAAELGTTMSDGTVTGKDVVAAVGVGLVSAALVYGFGNKPAV